MTVTDDRLARMRPPPRTAPPRGSRAGGCRPGRAGRPCCRASRWSASGTGSCRGCTARTATSSRSGSCPRLGARALHPARARQGDLRRRPRGLPRRQGQRDPRADHGRALPAAAGLRRAQARPPAADAGLQRRRPARLRRPGHRDRPRRGGRLDPGRAVPLVGPDERPHPRGHPPRGLRGHRRGPAGPAAPAGQPHRRRQPGGPAGLGLPLAAAVRARGSAPSTTSARSTR